MVSTPHNRQTFINSAIKFLHQYRFDELNLDWQFPRSHGSPAKDKHLFTILEQEIREAFEQEAFQNNSPRLMITATVAGVILTIQSGYEIPQLSHSLDYIQVMTYNLHGSQDGYTGKNSPLYKSLNDTGTNTFLNVDYIMTYWNENGAAPEKLIFGFPAYGQTFTLSDPSNTGICAPTISAGALGPYTEESGIWAYYEICTFLNDGATEAWDGAQEVPYTYQGNKWVGYDNVKSFHIKVLSKSVETFGKIEDLSVKNKDNELTQRNNQPFFWDFDYGKPDDYSFGTRQQRQLFPHSHPPTWLGNKFLPLRGMPHTGPGCYTASDWNGLAYNLSQTPTSTKGYAIGARTAVRFKPVKDVTPHPGMYQKFYAWNDKYKQSFAPFNALMPRFRTDVKGNSYPGPGTYNPEKKSPPKVVWPMKFGSPDWSQIPRLEKRTLKAELSTDKDFRKHRNRVAYLSLYYN